MTVVLICISERLVVSVSVSHMSRTFAVYFKEGYYGLMQNYPLKCQPCRCDPCGLWRCAMVSSTKALSEDPVSFEVGSPWVRLVCQVHVTDA